MNTLPPDQIKVLHSLPAKECIEFWGEIEKLGRKENKLNQAVAMLVLADLYYLLVQVCKRVDLLPCVGKPGYVDNQFAFERCREVEASPNGYLDLWGREHFKSSIITFGLTIQDILKNPELTFGIFSHTRPIAKAFLRQIMRELESNKLLHAAFPDVLWGENTKQAPKWSEDDGIIVKRKSNPNEATIEAWGLVDGQPTALAVDTPVLTTDGWKSHGALQAGDFVFGSDGYPIEVIFNTGQMIGKKCFRVVFDDTEIVAAEDHLWPVDRMISHRDKETGKQDSGWSFIERGIVKTSDLPLSTGPNRDKRHRMLSSPVLNFPGQNDLEIDPYILGWWLGDGSSDTGIITTGDYEIIPYLAEAGYPTVVAQDRGNYKMFRLLGLREQLKSMGLLWDKHIPEEYLNGSAGQRLSLLQGLMDSDGHCRQEWGVCTFTNCNRKLIEQTHFLAASLGLKPARIRSYDDGDENHNIRYTFQFVGVKHTPPFRLSRKKDRCVEERRNAGRYVRELAPVESVPVNCIQVASDNGLYLAGTSLVPTHNSKHFKVLLYDDVVVAGSVTTPDMISKTMVEMERSYNLGTTPGVKRGVGTRWHFNDAYKTVVERKTFTSREYPGKKEGSEEGKSVFWSEDVHLQKRRDMGPYTYAAQILLNPKADALQGFKREWLRHYKHVKKESLNWYLLFDAASSKKRGSDYTSGWAVGLGVDGNYYCIPEVRDRLNLKERADRVFRLHRAYKPKQVRYEKYGMMADVEHLKSRMENENYRFTITEVGGQTSKSDRIKRLVPLFEAGRIWLPENFYVTDWQKVPTDLVRSFIEEEYMAFPVGLHDDMLDSLSRICEPDFTLVWPMEEKPKKEAQPYQGNANLRWMA